MSQKNPSASMPLLAHLRELRRRLFIAALAVVLGMVVGWLLSPYAMNALRVPVETIAASTGRTASINYADITSAFNLKAQIAFFISLVITCPIWLWQIWGFFVPGLTRRERRTGRAFILISIPLFLGGCSAGWMVFPNIVRLMTGFASPHDTQIMDATVYIQFVLRLMTVVGVAFVLPLVLVALNAVGVISARSILRGWRVALLIIVLFTALATPAADVMSMLLLSIPLVVLYCAAAGVSWLHDWRAARRMREEEAVDE